MLGIDHSIIPGLLILIQELKSHFHYGFLNGGLSMLVFKTYGQMKSKNHCNFIQNSPQILQISQKSYSTRNLVFHGFFLAFQYHKILSTIGIIISRTRIQNQIVRKIHSWQILLLRNCTSKNVTYNKAGYSSNANNSIEERRRRFKK